MENIEKNSANVALDQYEVCYDWWTKVEPRTKYLISPDGVITKVGITELTFELITNSLKDLKVW